MCPLLSLNEKYTKTLYQLNYLPYNKTVCDTEHIKSVKSCNANQVGFPGLSKF